MCITNRVYCICIEGIAATATAMANTAAAAATSAANLASATAETLATETLRLKVNPSHFVNQFKAQSEPF